jgi:mannose-6-phosphate isomerase
VTREGFERALHDGTVEECLHRIPVRPGQAIFIPSGRIHAIGAGNLIVEIQQNSDTTYRVFDWNRAGLDGRPRALHVAESMASIDFADFEPEMAEPDGETLVACDFFRAEKMRLEAAREVAPVGEMALVTVLEGTVAWGGMRCGRGEFFLVPAALADRRFEPCGGPATVLRTTFR